MKRIYRVALAGNPNCGKTTIFNALTGTHQHVGNYSGVTVERKTGEMSIGDTEIEVVDLPGIYSLSSSTAEEKVAFYELMQSHIDLILNIVDAGNLQRNLFLTTQLADLNVPMILVFNMADDAERQGLQINYAALEQFFNAPILKTVGSKGQGVRDLKELMQTVLHAPSPRLPRQMDYGPDTTGAIKELTENIEKSPLAVNQHVPPRCFAIKMLENDEEILSNEYIIPLLPIADRWRKKIHARQSVNTDIYMTDVRYGMVAGACREAVKLAGEPRRRISEEIDSIVTNRYLGLPIFLILMFAVFFLTFACAEPLTRVIDGLLGVLTDLVVKIWPAGADGSVWNYARRLVTEGIIGGVGGVLVFLPNILVLFLAIAFLEGTGYMSRAAFVMDGFMHRFGLHGKSFIPMLLGFGCTVPAVMATRTIESHKDRLVTIMVLPLISCGARLPIYSLLIPAFFLPRYQALIMWTIYLIGVVLALICAGILKSTLFKGGDELFVMELPPYRMPALRGLLIYMWERTVMYLKKAGTVILLASVIMFLFNTLPMRKGHAAEYSAEIVKVEHSESLSDVEKMKQIKHWNVLKQKDELENSIAGQIGRTMTTAFRPLGFDWKICSALLGAFAGKELFVSQLGILNSFDDAEDEPSSFTKRLQQEYTPLQAFCIMLFCLISMPCIATVAVVRRETNSWLLTLGQLFGLTLMAYVITLIVYQLGIHL